MPGQQGPKSHLHRWKHHRRPHRPHRPQNHSPQFLHLRPLLRPLRIRLLIRLLLLLVLHGNAFSRRQFAIRLLDYLGA